ncbi:MAG: hypothetical protein M3Z36_04285 [Acidobacteriota bacterium]|nr:hypothetical protein [Acidobacteriota bacterium]
MKDHLIWAFIPFSIEDGRLSGDSYDNARTKCELAETFNELGLPWVWQPIVPGNMQEIVSQVAEYRNRFPCIVFNFCDGADSDGKPGLSVVRALEIEGIPFTGADSRFFEISTSKLRMKPMFAASGLATPAFEALPDVGPVAGVCERLGTPLIVKPDISSASQGISLRSKVFSDAEAASRRDELVRNFAHSAVLVERFVEGREFTVFVTGDHNKPATLRALPAERIFDSSIPPGERFLSFDRYWGYYKEETAPARGAPFYGYAEIAPDLRGLISDFAQRAYCALQGTGYGRVDIRMEKNGKPQLLEVNANCGLSGDDETSTGSILEIAGLRFSSLVASILEHALSRRCV